MNQKFNPSELHGKSVEELRAMLADDALLPLDDDSNTDTILNIMEVIKSKEYKTDERREAERVEFWAGLLVRHGDKIPVRLENVVSRRKSTGSRQPASVSRVKRRFPLRGAVRRSAFAAAIALALLIGNSLAAYAFNFNVLRTIVDFTDELFDKTIVATDNAPGSADTLNGGADESDAFQDALDELGIARPHAPKWLPDGFAFEFVQLAKGEGYDVIAVQYKNGEMSVVFTVSYYSKPIEERTRHIEKNAGNPTNYSYCGIDFYIFTNMDMTVATWTDGMADCDIQGDISEGEMKNLINSMYTED
jgi:hypothetical protein